MIECGEKKKKKRERVSGRINYGDDLIIIKIKNKWVYAMLKS